MTESKPFENAAEEIARLRAELASIRAENLRLHRLLGVTGRSVEPDQPSQDALFVGDQGRVDAHSPVQRKLALYRTLFAGRDDVHALRWENARTGKAGWVPAVEGGWRKHGPRNYLPLTDDVLASHLTGDTHAGLYPLMPSDVCRLVVADFDGQAALLDALAYLKAARAVDIPASLEVSRSGTGAHVWIFFSGNVPASTARRIGAGLLRDFPSQDFLPASGSIGNLIALPFKASVESAAQPCSSNSRPSSQSRISGRTCPLSTA